jgi:hypothetical protein
MTFVIKAELIFLQYSFQPLTQGITNKVWDVNLKTLAVILSVFQSRRVHVGLDWSFPTQNIIL